MSDLVSDLVSCDMHPFTPLKAPAPQPQPHPQRASMCNSYTPRYFSLFSFWVSLSIYNNFKIFVPFESICRMLEFLPLLPSPKIDWPLPSVVNILATILFLLECYHFIGHVCVLFRVRLLPRKDVVRIRYYFLFDTFTVFTVCFLYTEKAEVAGGNADGSASVLFLHLEQTVFYQ